MSKSNRSNITNAVFISKLEIQTMQQINEIDRFEVIRSTIDNRCLMHTLDLQ